MHTAESSPRRSIEAGGGVAALHRNRKTHALRAQRHSRGPIVGRNLHVTKQKIEIRPVHEPPDGTLCEPVILEQKAIHS